MFLRSIFQTLCAVSFLAGSVFADSGVSIVSTPATTTVYLVRTVDCSSSEVTSQPVVTVYNVLKPDTVTFTVTETAGSYAKRSIEIDSDSVSPTSATTTTPVASATDVSVYSASIHVPTGNPPVDTHNPLSYDTEVTATTTFSIALPKFNKGDRVSSANTYSVSFVA
ncbi:Protein adg1 [Schizosaccharomyces pombe]|uniref:Protein adg1 n=1 Tax=Schizosaccharomyces pombe (strain 972 / ATCC 24843) TaxID=284812 RepID=ADG1_SCHPO|nr:protein adg1 [Schizosaccharomyces pombe]Q9P7E7.1 RecName: Full=Protein adg1; Flags: Precursor [Schizosaccharomyces pombe 972h-]CAB83086.1 sequence orphan [Schizosaccharomyces pombe]|eukprot:NP_594922.1 protein adg1 [Schizosaccharomyces pombe]